MCLQFEDIFLSRRQNYRMPFLKVCYKLCYSHTGDPYFKISRLAYI
uniref:Alternative protein TM9SF3 n=1 Tax=Homo sapiens TaxID=9606 RepID=L8EB11_HUMAN|nr:alternative protein TM9SF3 [Homo sapiens]